MAGCGATGEQHIVLGKLKEFFYSASFSVEGGGCAPTSSTHQRRIALLGLGVSVEYVFLDLTKVWSGCRLCSWWYGIQTLPNCSS